MNQYLIKRKLSKEFQIKFEIQNLEENMDVSKV